MAVRWHRLLQQIINTAELFELILLQLDIRDLLAGAQRVSRSWKTFIEQSSALQRHLYLSPNHRPTLEGDNSDGQLDFCPLLIELFPMCFIRGGYALPTRLEDYAQQPFVKTLAAFMQPGASWRRMLVQQRPPITHIGRWRSDHSWTGFASFSATIDACHPPESQFCAATGWNMAGQEYVDGITFRPHQRESTDESKKHEDPYLRMGMLYDLVTRAVSPDGPSTRLFWTGASPVDRMAFFALMTSGPAHLVHQPTEIVAQRERFEAECLVQSRKLADDCGLVVAETQMHGWCGTMALDLEDSLAFRTSFLHPDGPWGAGKPGPEQFDTVYRWKGDYEGPGMQDDL